MAVPVVAAVSVFTCLTVTLAGDVDHDTVGDLCDNCITTVNTNQSDVDRDLVGDACGKCRKKTNWMRGLHSKLSLPLHPVVHYTSSCAVAPVGVLQTTVSATSTRTNTTATVTE